MEDGPPLTAVTMIVRMAADTAMAADPLHLNRPAPPGRGTIIPIVLRPGLLVRLPYIAASADTVDISTGMGMESLANNQSGGVSQIQKAPPVSRQGVQFNLQLVTRI